MRETSGPERRLKPRYNVSLPCSVTLPSDERDILFPNERIECRTRDISETGVGIVAPSIYIGYTCVVDEGRELVLTIELPARSVSMRAAAAHYLRLGAGGGHDYVIGLRVSAMTDEDRAAYLSFLGAVAEGS